MENYKDYLEHHGILGQKWGQRNGPPYPLSVGQYSGREKRLNDKLRKNRNNINKTGRIYNRELTTVLRKMNNARTELDVWSYSNKQNQDRIEELKRIYQDGRNYVENILHDAENQGFLTKEWEGYGPASFVNNSIKDGFSMVSGIIGFRNSDAWTVGPGGDYRKDYQYANIKKQKRD